MIVPKGTEEAFFKPAPGGWVYSAANPWVIGPRKIYLVNDTQKATLAERIRQGRPLRLLALVPLLWAALVLGPYLQEPTTTIWLLIVSVVLALAFWINLAGYLAVRDELINLTPSTEPIS
jgi:hypothetical protein